MTTIYLAQKFFTFRDGFSVYGGDGQVVYTIKTPLISLTSELKVDSPSGKQAGEVRKSMDPLFPGYNLFVNGKKIGRLYQEMALFGSKMHVTRLEWTVEGDLTGWSYKVKKGFSTIGSISHQFWHMTDHYAISFAPELFIKFFTNIACARTVWNMKVNRAFLLVYLFVFRMINRIRLEQAH